MATNPWFIASIATGVTGFAVGLPAGYVWLMMALTKDTCTSLDGKSRESFFCPSDSTRNAWFAAAAIGLAVGTVGIAAFPQKVKVAPSVSNTGGGAVVIGES
jgi:hypothetical protein